MKKLMKNMIIVLMGVGLCTTFAQGKTGIGFEFQTLSHLTFVNPGTNLGVFFPISSNGWLIEPEITFYKSTEEIDYKSASIEDTKVVKSDLTLLIGIFKTSKREKIRLYYGIRAGMQFEKEDYDNNDNDEDLDYLILAPTIGAEYLISENFSFGGEGVYTMVSNTQDEDSYERTIKVTTVIPRFIVRYYF